MATLNYLNEIINSPGKTFRISAEEEVMTTSSNDYDHHLKYEAFEINEGRPFVSGTDVITISDKEKINIGIQDIINRNFSNETGPTKGKRFFNLIDDIKDSEQDLDYSGCVKTVIYGNPTQFQPTVPLLEVTPKKIKYFMPKEISYNAGIKLLEESIETPEKYDSIFGALREKFPERKDETMEIMRKHLTPFYKK